MGDLLHSGPHAKTPCTSAEPRQSCQEDGTAKRKYFDKSTGYFNEPGGLLMQADICG